MPRYKREADVTVRILGVVLAAVLLAANLILIRKAAAHGRLAGATVGLFGVAVAMGVPCVLAILFGMGEGPAFLKLLSGIVGTAALVGAIVGVCSAGKKTGGTIPAESQPIVAEVIDPE